MPLPRPLLVPLFLLFACSPGRVDNGDGGDDTGGTPPTVACKQGETHCMGLSFQICQAGQFKTSKTCVAPQICGQQGCSDCRPGLPLCVGDEVHQCTADGKIGPLVMACAQNQCRSGVCMDDCQNSSKDLIYVVDETYQLLSFEPKDNKNTFTVIGKLNCPAGASWPGWAGTGSATPFSMSIDRNGQAWVLYTSGEIFWVSTQDASCKPSPFKKGQNGFELFGMGFVVDDPGTHHESLYVAGGAASMVENGNLGRIDPMSLVLSPIGKLPQNQYGPELTGTGKGDLFAYFPSQTQQTRVMQLDKTNAQPIMQWPLDMLPGMARAWAFAHWGGRYYIFITTQDDLGLTTTSQVHLFDPKDGSKVVLLPDIPYVIVGAGVSTCAPVIIG